MAQVVAGDPDKMGILYERYKIPLYSYFYKFTGGDGATSEDLVHTVFYRALKYNHTWRGEGKFTTWLFSIAHNVGIDFYRKKKVKTINIDIPFEKPMDSHQDRSLEDGETYKNLIDALGMLPVNERELLLFSKQDGLTYQEIGHILHCSENVAKVRSFRAMKKLRTIFLKLENA